MYSSFGARLRDQMITHGLAAPLDMLGCTDEQIDEIRNAQGVDYLPEVYRQFLKEMGHSAGRLYQGSDFECRCLAYLKSEVDELAEDIESPFRIPADAFVFMTHQGCAYWYFDTGDREDDPSVYRFDEIETIPVKVSEHLSSFLEDSVKEYSSLF